MMGLSFRQPWGWAITDLPEEIAKRLENRVWRQLRNGKLPSQIRFDEDFAIHVSASKPEDFDIEGVEAAAELDELPDEAYLRSAILGVAQIAMVLRTDEKCTIIDGTRDKPFPHYVLRDEDQNRYVYDLVLDGKTPSPHTLKLRYDQIKRWWLGPYAFVLHRVRRCKEPIKEFQGAPVKGALNFWPVPTGLEAMIQERL